ncbi:unnamed protein product [Pieris macdunnoughi]|uniref:Uncharacterized protein n=1 Tax=Pieris macdunnoughi TaxID=345717 RepID=A0A821RXR9_9NEOP|nr:unnamed protein product [Pieris macdunnoughi]
MYNRDKQTEKRARLMTKRTERRERSYKVTVLPKLQYCRVVSRECCGAGGAAYTSDAVERHLCSLRVPWDRERLTRVGHAAPPPPPAEAPPPPPPPGPFIYNTHTRLTARRPTAPPDDGTERPTQTDVLMVTGQTLTPDAVPQIDSTDYWISVVWTKIQLPPLVLRILRCIPILLGTCTISSLVSPLICWFLVQRLATKSPEEITLIRGGSIVRREARSVGASSRVRAATGVRLRFAT